jgi:hypothetical protein
MYGIPIPLCQETTLIDNDKKDIIYENNNNDNEIMDNEIDNEIIDLLAAKKVDLATTATNNVSIIKKNDINEIEI